MNSPRPVAYPCSPLSLSSNLHLDKRRTRKAKRPKHSPNDSEKATYQPKEEERSGAKLTVLPAECPLFNVNVRRNNVKVEKGGKRRVILAGYSVRFRDHAFGWLLLH